MRIDRMRVTCSACSWVGEVEVVVDAPVTVAVASMKAARCGKCGSNKLGIGGEYPDQPPVTAPLVERVAWWQDRGERGISSNTIFTAFTGAALPHGSHGKPHDPDDYNRCRKLLELIPEWRAELGKVADAYPYWRPLVDAWPEFERLWAEEYKGPKSRMSRLYERMCEVGVESDRLHGLKSVRFAGGTVTFKSGGSR